MLSIFSKFYGKVGVIFWFLFHLIWKNYVLYWGFDLKSWIVNFSTRFTQEKTPQNKFSSQNFSVENNYLAGIIFSKEKIGHCLNFFIEPKITFHRKLITQFLLYFINYKMIFYRELLKCAIQTSPFASFYRVVID